MNLENNVSTDHKLYAILAHASVFVGLGIIVPLILFLVVKDSDFVRHHAKQALVNQTAFLIGYIISCILMLILVGFLFLPILGIMQLIFTIIAIIKTIDGEYYEYPITKDIAKKL